MIRFFCFLSLFLTAALPAADLYVWQRQHNSALLKETAKFYAQSSGKLYFIAGEFEDNNSIITVKPSPAVHWNRATAVVRIHIRQMKKTPAQLAGEIVTVFQAWSKCKALQIDLDAPESKLDYYRDLMLELRKKLPGVELSATVLPCHIKHTGEFKALAKVCDFYVLQVHGLSKNASGYFIMDENIARNAIKRAKNLQLPYKVALPLYCHTVERNISVQPDLHLTARLADEVKNVIGFRLGVPGDKEALDLASVLQILDGKYAPQLDIFWQQQANGAWYLMVRNRGFFPQKISCKFNLPQKTVIMDMDAFGSGKLDRMQRTIEFTLPPAGSIKACMWLRCSAKENLNQENAFNIKFNPERSSAP
jgi:hypothetical protein